jgi:DNA-directed RNA polymerase specialized sigma24 family protein
MAQKPRPPDPDRLERAVAKLSPIEREVLLLSAREGLRADEIAARTGLPSAAVERHLADAVYNLDRLLERQDRPWWQFW